MKKFKLTKDHKEAIACIIDEAIVDCTNDIVNPDAPSDKAIELMYDDDDLIDASYAQVEQIIIDEIIKVLATRKKLNEKLIAKVAKKKKH